MRVMIKKDIKAIIIIFFQFLTVATGMTAYYGFGYQNGIDYQENALTKVNNTSIYIESVNMTLLSKDMNYSYSIRDQFAEHLITHVQIRIGWWFELDINMYDFISNESYIIIRAPIFRIVSMGWTVITDGFYDWPEFTIILLEGSDTSKGTYLKASHLEFILFK